MLTVCNVIHLKALVSIPYVFLICLKDMTVEVWDVRSLGLHFHCNHDIATIVLTEKLNNLFT